MEKDFDIEKLERYIIDNSLTYYIETYGCQMNAHDSEKISGILSSLGYSRAQDKDKADLVLFNTCCVRENAENKIYGNVGKMKQYKKHNEDMIVGVCGCMMQQKGVADDLFRMFPFVELAFGTTNMQDLPEMLYHIIFDKERIKLIEDDKIAAENVPMKRTPPPLSTVNIMQGCNNFCTYCIVPYVRGREHSRRIGDIITEVESLMKDGYREVMLLGQNVNSYGSEFDRVTFPMLLEEVAKTGIDRIRFMTSHPKDATLELFETMARHDNICNQLHLPVQAGSSRVLKAMNRRYTREDYLSLIKTLRSIIPDVVLSSDIMIGFPGETDDEFEETVSLMEEVRYDSAFTFVYSPRKGTPAAEMPDQIPEEIKQKRIMKIVALQNRITYESNLKDVGRSDRVLVEGKSSRDEGFIAGKTDGGKMVNLRGDISLVGQIIPVRIAEAKKTTLVGEIEGR